MPAAVVGHRAQRLRAVRLSLPANQAKLEAAEQLAVLARRPACP